MPSVGNLSLLALYGIFSVSNAYWVDPVSCKNPPIDTEKLIANIDAAFAMAKDGYFALDAVIRSTPDKKENAEQLANWIFGEGGGGQNGKWEQGLYAYLVDSYSVRKDDKDEIRFYCDTSRLKVSTKDKETRTIDNDNKFTMKGDSIKACDQGPGSKAWTLAVGHDYSTIQLCPWYLSFVGAAKYTGWKSMLMKAGNAFDKGFNFLEGLAPIDGMALFDHTILHELTHTSQSIGSKDIEDGKSYQWGNVRRLSTDEKSWNNAESLAYFALGSQMINSGYTITQDGKFTKPGASKREEHELWPRLWIA